INAAHDNTVINTYVGTNSKGETTLGNQLGGILIGDTATKNTIGDAPGTATRPIFVLVSGNTGNGITMEAGTTFTQVLNNIIGYAKDGKSPLPNSGEPIAVLGSGATDTISGNQVFACFAAGTRIATDTGDVAVEDLREGDMVQTHDGA